MTTIRIHNEQTTTTIDTEMFFYEGTAAWYIVIGDEKYNAYPECDNTADCYLSPFNPLYITIENAPTIINGKKTRESVFYLRGNTSHIFTLNNIKVVYNNDLHAYVGIEEEKVTVTESYDIPLDNLTNLENKLQTLNNKARKYGFSAICLVKGEEYIVTRDVNYQKEKIPYIHITVEYQTIKIGDYAVLAIMQHTLDTGNVVKTLATLDEKTMQHVFTCDNRCEHCNISRQRNTTFLLEDKAGAYKQVGKQCLKLYTGLDASKACSYAECIQELKEEISDDEKIEGRSYNYLATEYFLSYVFSSIKQWGWISRERAGNENLLSTAIDALERCEKHLELTTEDKEQARNVIQWIAELQVPYSNEYLTNVKTLVTSKSFPRKNIGYVASVYSAYNRAKEQARKDSEKIKSVHLKSEEKSKVDLNVKILKSVPFTSDYGLSNVTTAQCVTGEIVKWFGGLIGDVNDVYRIVGTIKKFDYDTFLKEDVTILTRVTLWQEKPVKPVKSKKA